MVHVWITPHPCGVFAALEGIGAGTAAVSEEQRVDMCDATTITTPRDRHDAHAETVRPDEADRPQRHARA